MARSRKKPETPEEPKAPSDAFVGLLAISLLALIAAAVFLHLDHDELSKKKLDQPKMSLSTEGLGGTAPARN
jgi:hypothetical protein